MTPRILVVIASVRDGRSGGTVGRWFVDLASARDDLEVDVADLRELDLPPFRSAVPPARGEPAEDPRVRDWAARIAAADGFVFVVPEYNHGYPAALKDAIDHVHPEWARKAASFVGYGGMGGGIRAVEQLRQVVVELEVAPLRRAVHLPRVFAAFEDGRPTEPWHERAATGLLDELVWWTRALATARAADADLDGDADEDAA